MLRQRCSIASGRVAVLQAPPRRHRSCMARAAAAKDDYLAAQITNKEGLLAAMFDSGKPMPSASEVAELRNQIAELRAQLTGQPMTTASPTFQYNAMSNGLASFQATSSMEERLELNPTGLGAENDAEIARLEAENMVLRAQAHQLLTYQQQLEELLMKGN